MLGISYLNEIISNDNTGIEPTNEEDVNTFAKILDKMRERVVNELRQTVSENDSKDGMDISLLRVKLNEGNKEHLVDVQWAGANNSLIIISNNEVKEIKANEQPIG